MFERHDRVPRLVPLALVALLATWFLVQLAPRREPVGLDVAFPAAPGPAVASDSRLAAELERTGREIRIVLRGDPEDPAVREILSRFRRIGTVDEPEPEIEGIDHATIAREPDPLLTTFLVLLVDPRRARAVLDRVLHGKPGLVPALVFRAEVHRLGHRPELARADLEAALAIDPTSTAARRILVRLSVEAGDVEGAIAGCGDVLAIDPADAYARSTRGAMLLARGELDSAAADLEAATDLVAGPEPLVGLARIERARGRFAVAEARADAALARDPDSAAARLERGVARAATGEAGPAFFDLALAGRSAREGAEGAWRDSLDAIEAGDLVRARRTMERSAELGRLADEAARAALQLSAVALPWGR